MSHKTKRTTRERLLRLVKERPTRTAPELARRLGVTPMRAYQLLWAAGYRRQSQWVKADEAAE